MMIFVFLPTHSSCALRLSGRAEQSSAFIGVLSGMAGEMNSLSTSRPKIPSHATMTLCTMCASFLCQKAGSAKRTEAARVRLRNCVRQGHHIFHDMMTDLKCHCERRVAVHSFSSFHAKDSRMGSFIGAPSQRRRWRCGIASALREAMESSKIRR